MGCSRRKRAPLQLRAVDLGHELQVHPGLALPLGHHCRAHAGVVRVRVQTTPVGPWRAAHHHVWPRGSQDANDA
eukprot:11821393-Alexandrium_andersonii.AAC.1